MEPCGLGGQLFWQRTEVNGIGGLRVIVLIDDPAVIRRILEHLGLWAPLAAERSPPLGPASWPTYASLPLTYRPVPDIA